MDVKPTQYFRRSIVGRSDLVAAIARHDLLSLQAIAEQLGLQPELPRLPSPRTITTVKPGTTNDRSLLEIDSSGYPKQLQPLPLWLNTSYSVEAPLLKKPEGRAYVKWHDKPTEYPSYQLLSPWREVGPRLRRGLMDSHAGKLLDLKTLVSKFAKREMTSVLPRKRKRRWGRRVLVIKDTSLRLSPFQRDHHEIIQQLGKLLPSDCLTVAEGVSPLALTEVLSKATLRERKRLTTNSILPRTQILVLGDLGCLGETDHHWKTWLRWAKRTDALGCNLLALLPSGEFSIPPALRSLFSIQTWQRSFGLRCDPALRSDILSQLFVLASPALRVEPGLLRDLRLLLPERSDACLEVDFWSSELLSSNHPWGATLDYREVNSVLRPKFEQLDLGLRRSVLERIRRWRLQVQHAPEIWFEELLCLDAVSQSLFNKDLEDAYACFREIDKQRETNDDDRTYMHRLTQRANDNALVNPTIGILIRDAKRELHPNVKEIAAGTDPRELPTGRVRRFRVNVTDNQLCLGLANEESDEADLSLCTAIVSSNAVFRIEARRTQSDVQFWKSGKKPRFVSAFGRDEFGAWFEFDVPHREKQGVVTQRMRWIRAGTFMMGAPNHEPERRDNEVLHKVTLTRGFWLADTTCTQSMWQAVMGEPPSQFKGAERPVEQVNYQDVARFCDSLSKQFPGLTMQMPTEAQWEYACRAGMQTPFSFGTTISTDQVNFHGNYPYNKAPKGSYRKEAVGVKDLPCNPWGLYQMHGNVWEWCEDWYAEYLIDDLTDPKGPESGSYRVLRGGSWFLNARDVRSACRFRSDPGIRGEAQGFRLLSSANAEPIEIAEVPIAELSRIGSAEERFREFRVRVEDQQPAELKIDGTTNIRVFSNLEVVELHRLTKPDWAVEFGRDAYGVYGDFDLPNAMAGNSVRQRLRWISPGSFQMGSPPDEPGRYKDELLHPVTISSGFWMFDTPCPQRLWTAIMEENPSHFPDPDRPVESVDWDQTNEFAERLSKRLSGHPASPMANLTFSLPTEAQWEYACRAGTSTAIYTGPLEILGDDSAPALDTISWHVGNSGHKDELDKSIDVSEFMWHPNKQSPFIHAGTRRIKQKAPNPWGLYDMLGNVWEWCSDWYAENLEDVIVDPQGPESGSARVIRGGCWFDYARYVRSACRNRYAPGKCGDYLGFRLLSLASPGPVT